MIELFFIVPYFFGKAMENEKKRQVEEQNLKEYLRAKAIKRAQGATKEDYELITNKKLNESGCILDQDSVIGRLVQGNEKTLAGKIVGENGVILDENGNRIGKVVPVNAKDENQGNLEQDIENYKNQKSIVTVADIIQQSIDKMKPILKTMACTISCEDKKTKDKRNENKLVKHTQLLLEQASQSLNEAFSTVHKNHSKIKTDENETSEEEKHLAKVLAQMISTVLRTIDKTSKKTVSMPHIQTQIVPHLQTLQISMQRILSLVNLLLDNILKLVKIELNRMGIDLNIA